MGHWVNCSKMFREREREKEKERETERERERERERGKNYTNHTYYTEYTLYCMYDSKWPKYLPISLTYKYMHNFKQGVH